jgi:uncharacterized membrane protein (UPF0127 family)
MKIKYKSKNIEISNIRKLYGIKNFTSGLMFCRREKSRALLFNFDNSVSFNFTSLFVFFPFFIIWLDKYNNILDIKLVKPFRWIIPSKKSYKKVLEIPLNKFYKDKFSSIVGIQKSL